MLILFFITVGVILVEVFRLENYTFRKFFNSLFGNVMRNHESIEFSGATYLMVSSIFTIAVFPADIAFLSLSFLAIGDTMAALVGVHLGKRKIFSTKKSVEGTLSCFVSTFIFALLFRVNPIIAFVGAVAATIAEFSRLPLDDNFKIPI
ncbi:MAG: phosphatidate cytidylyltransferase, partial [Candidatus Cloacimonadota bacterium]|nr:phosphatidate cytidylyltransferase [Candidatus Cloacimonadota bacterium]